MRLYAFALIAVLLLIIGGTIFVTSRSPVAPTQSTLTWGGGAPLSAYENGSASQQSPQQIVQEVIQSQAQTQAPSTLSIPALAGPTTSPQATSASSSFSYDDFLAQLNGNTSVSSSVQASSTSAAQLIAEAYEFVPTGLVATTAPAKKPMTADQEALYDYGNEVGGEIQSFEELHSDQAEVLKDQAEDRTDPTKAAALVSLGQALASVGTYMQQMQDVPSDVTAQHNALAQSYLDIGAKLQVVAQAQSDADFVQAVENYDTSANTFVKNYGTLAQFFSEQGVVFAPQDPGSVFSFTDTSGAGGL